MPIREKKSRPRLRRDRRARRARSTRIRTAKVATVAVGRAPRAERPARAPRVISARRRARVGRVRKTARCVHEYPYAKKVTETPRRAASPAPRRRADANPGAPRPGHTRVPSPHASLSSRAPGGVLARPRVVPMITSEEKNVVRPPHQFFRMEKKLWEK